MILKKPYAFIIKHFRLIHILLLIPILFIVIKTRGICLFFNTYINNNYTFSSSDVISNLANEYISIWIYLVILLILIVLIFLTIVLQKKEKPVRFYHFSIIYYIVLIILLTGCFSIFTMIERDSLDEIMARLVRDLSWVVYASEFILVIMMLIRGSGFNIKKFSFQSDLLDLEISHEDNEEFEFLVGTDTYKHKRNIRRFLRELKYYIKENKFILTAIIIIVALILGVSLYRGKEEANITYEEGISIPFGYINYTIKDSFASTTDKSGNIINEDKAYVILQIELNNRYREDKEFNYRNLELLVDNNYYAPNISYGNLFVDYGSPYNGTLVKGNTKNTYVFVYEIPKNSINSKMQIISYTMYGNSTINLRPTIINEKEGENIINKGTTISLKNTILLNSSLTLMDYTLTNRFVYTYKSCISSKDCYDKKDVISVDLAKDYNKTLMLVDYALTLDSESSYMTGGKTYQTFFRDFMHLEYTIDNKTYSYTPDIVNPNNYADKLIMKVPKEINSATNVKAIINIRGKSFIIDLTK